MPQGLTIVKSEPLPLTIAKSEPVQAVTPPPPAATPPPPPIPSNLEQAWNRSGIPGAVHLAKDTVESAVDIVRHPVRNLPLIGGAIGGTLGFGAGGPPGALGGAAIGAAGGEAWRQNYESGKSLVTGRPVEQPHGLVANQAPPTTTPGGAAISIAREAVTSGVLPEVVGQGTSRVLRGVLRPAPGSADAAVAQTSKDLDLGLTAGEISSSTAGRALHQVEKVGNIGAVGHAVTEKGRAAGEAKATEVLGAQLDKISARTGRTQAGEAVSASAKDAEAILREQHRTVQYQRELAHGKNEAARRATHTAQREAAQAAHLEAQAEAAGAHDAAEAAKASEFRAGNQAVFDKALKAKQAAGQQMAQAAKGVTTPVRNEAVQAEAQRLIETELRPPAEAYPLKVAEDAGDAATAAAAKKHAASKGGSVVPFDQLPADAQAYLREQAAATGEAVPAELNPLDYASKKVRDHLTRIANAQPTSDFGAAWQYYSDLLADSKFLKALREPGEGQLSALAKTLRGSLEEAATASGVDWAKVSAGHASAADASREAARNLSKRYTPKKYAPAGFKYPAYKPEAFKADPFTAGANLNRLLTDEPSQLLDAFSKKGVVVPERIRAARETLLGTVADKPVVAPPASQATRNAAMQAEQVASGVKPGTPGAAASYKQPAATPPPAPAGAARTPADDLAAKQQLMEDLHDFHAELGHPLGDRDDFSGFIEQAPEDVTWGELHSAQADLEKIAKRPMPGRVSITPPAATPPPAVAPPQPGIPPRPPGPWDANTAPPLPTAGDPAKVAAAQAAQAAPSAVHQRGQKAWDQLRTTLVRDQILDGPIHGLKARLDKFGPAGLKELFPEAPQVGENLQRIGEAFARRGPQPPTWQYRTLEVLTSGATVAAAGFGNLKAAGSAAGVLAGLEGVPAVIAWAAHSPKWTKLLLEGVTTQDTTKALTALTRVTEGFQAERKPKAATPPPAPPR